MNFLYSNGLKSPTVKTSSAHLTTATPAPRRHSRKGSSVHCLHAPVAPPLPRQPPPARALSDPGPTAVVFAPLPVLPAIRLRIDAAKNDSLPASVARCAAPAASATNRRTRAPAASTNRTSSVCIPFSRSSGASAPALLRSSTRLPYKLKHNRRYSCYQEFYLCIVFRAYYGTSPSAACNIAYLFIDFVSV